MPTPACAGSTDIKVRRKPRHPRAEQDPARARTSDLMG
jgi:hypothetical protein